MQNVARLFQMLIANTKNEIKAVRPLRCLSLSKMLFGRSALLWCGSANKGGQFALSFKDFKVMSESDQAIWLYYCDINARRAAGRFRVKRRLKPKQRLLSWYGYGSSCCQRWPVSSEVAKQNAQIVI